LPHSASPEALFSSKAWFLLPPDRPLKPKRSAVTAPTAVSQTHWTEPLLLTVKEVKNHSDTVVACAHGMDDRNAAESLRGARIFVPRSSFPAAADGEYYWVDLLGLQVLNREGLDLGQVRDLMSTGPQTVLVIEAAPEAEGGKSVERMIPFVSAFVDAVDLPGKRITVDWQPDY
jgi:16S rRNA processing protein RimM